MLSRDQAGLVAYVAEHSSAVALALRDATDPRAAAAALHRAVAAICRIPHPVEPDTPLPNWCEVVDEAGVPVLRIDIKDDSRYAEQIVRIVLDELDAAGVDGRLEPRQPRQPPYDYDADADIFTGMDFLWELDPRGLPPGFPAGFPVPEQATLVIAQRRRGDVPEHAAWRRRGRPFTEYLDRLRAFGCEFGGVPAAETADFADRMGMVRYAIWRAGAGGSVSLYHEWRRPGRRVEDWYVSVVWQPHADRPATPVQPPTYGSASDQDRAEPGRAELLVPPEQRAGCEMLLAIGEAAYVVVPIVDEARRHDDRRAGMALLWERLAPRLGGLGAAQLAAVRHACVTMVPSRVNLARDDDGYLYLPDFRRRAAGMLPPDRLAAVEAALALAGAATALDPLIHDLRRGVRQPDRRLSRILAGGITPELAVEVRDACRHLAEGR